MASGLKTLHEIDTAIAKARSAVDEASGLTLRASNALADTKRREAVQYDLIAKERLSVLDEDAGGELGYVDRKAAKFLDDYKAAFASATQDVAKARKALEQVESDRRTAEKTVMRAIDNYDKAAAAAEIKLLDDPDYKAQIEAVIKSESQLTRASDKQALAVQDEKEKGKAFLNDPYFSYLQSRGYGTDHHLGWFLTKALDGWVARRVKYRDSAQTYRRLTAIPQRLSRHVEILETKLEDRRAALEQLEADILKREGVDALRAISLEKQAALEAIDETLETVEAQHQDILDRQTNLASGKTGPLKDAIELIAKTLKKADRRTLQKLTSQTLSRSDDEALDELRSLSQLSEDLSDDHAQTRRLAEKYRKTLSDLERVRKNFKKRRFDAPSSDFENGEMITRLLGQVIVGALAGDDFWRQLRRFQKTVKRYSDYDFGGKDWTEGLRLPKNNRRRNSGGWDDIFGSGSSGGPFGGSSRKRSSRSSFPRTPTIRLPRSSGSSRSRSGSRSGGSRRSGGGFRTGGGF